MYLPPYWLDLNPIEEAFAKLSRRCYGEPGTYLRGAHRGDGPSSRRGDGERDAHGFFEYRGYRAKAHLL